MNQRYQHCTIAFNGYEERPTTKDPTHQRRAGGSVGSVVNFTSQTVMKLKKDLFLNNTVNKQKFINVLYDAFKRTDYTVLHANDDADVLIVKIAVGYYTDLLILLCFYANIHSKSLYLKPEPRQKTKTPRVWDIKKVKNVLGEQIYACILFVDALMGCDTTSRMHGIRKPAALKKILTCNGMELTVLQFAAKAKGQSCSNATKPIPMDDVPDDD